MKFAGYILSAKGHTVDPEKIRAITEMEYPTNVSELRRFCGMVNYLAKYVQGLATLMEPLHQLTRKDSLWEWMPEHSMAFDRIKKSLVSAPTLIFFLTTRSRTLKMATQVTTIAAPTLEPDQELGGCSRRRWFTWKVKWNAFATRTKLSGEDADVQIATLVSALPGRAIEALDTLPYENQSDKKDVKKILELLEAEYLDDVNEIYESYIFFTRQQEEGEPYSDLHNRAKATRGNV